MIVLLNNVSLAPRLKPKGSVSPGFEYIIISRVQHFVLSIEMFSRNYGTISLRVLLWEFRAIASLMS